MTRNSARIGEIRQWLKPKGYIEEYRRFMVIEVTKLTWTDDCACVVLYPNGIKHEIMMSDLFQDPNDPEDDEYSVCIDEADDEGQDGADQDRILQG